MQLLLADSPKITHDIFIRSLIITIALISVMPVIGIIINKITAGIFHFLFGLLDRSNRLYLIFMNNLTFPGVMYHELSHALWVILTGARLVHVSLYHKEDDNLGHVTYEARGNFILQSVQKALTSCAPVFMGLLMETFIVYILISFTLPIWGKVLCIYFFLSVLTHMDMSSQDMKCYLKGLPVCFIIIYIISLIALTLSNPAA